MGIEQISKEQYSKMFHALGLGRKKKPTRNYFYCDGNDPHWSDLVEKGIATRSAGWTEGKAYFRLTFEGAEVDFLQADVQEIFLRFAVAILRSRRSGVS